MLKLSSLKIDPEFSAQILPLSFEELHQLELNMIRMESLQTRSLCGTKPFWTGITVTTF